jgi:hypothetical protein
LPASETPDQNRAILVFGAGRRFRITLQLRSPYTRGRHRRTRRAVPTRFDDAAFDAAIQETWGAPHFSFEPV